MLKWEPPFDPEETKRYSRDWTAEMDAASDTIASANFIIETPDTGLAIMDTSVDASGKIATLWISSQDRAIVRTKLGSIVLINHTITTNGGTTLNERIGLKLLEK